jgi:hypothetical protein
MFHHIQSYQSSCPLQAQPSQRPIISKLHGGQQSIAHTPGSVFTQSFYLLQRTVMHYRWQAFLLLVYAAFSY